MLELSDELDRHDEIVQTDIDVAATELPRVEISGGVSATGSGRVLTPEDATDATFGEDDSEAANVDLAGAPASVQFELTEEQAVEAAITAARGMVDGPGPGDTDESDIETDVVDIDEGNSTGTDNRLPPSPPDNDHIEEGDQYEPEGRHEPAIPPRPLPDYFADRLRRDIADNNVRDDPGIYGLDSADAVRENVEAARKFMAKFDRDGDVDTPDAGEGTDGTGGYAEEFEDVAEQVDDQDPPEGNEPPNGGGREPGDGDHEGGEGRRLYTPSDVARHVARDRVVLSGVSPDAGRQNQELVERFRQKAAEMGDDVIAVQFIGSRANGTSGLDSDLDASIITFGDNLHREEARQPFYDTAATMNITADLDLAGRAASGIPDEVPEDPEEFLLWVEHGVEGRENVPISLFDDGVYRTDDQLLLRLAVVEVIGAYPYENQRADNWQRVRDHHADEYLGNLDRMREKLTERLGATREDEVRRALSQQLMRERRERFGLPADRDAYQQRLNRWVARNDERLQPTRGYRLLQAVRAAL